MMIVIVVTTMFITVVMVTVVMVVVTTGGCVCQVPNLYVSEGTLVSKLTILTLTPVSESVLQKEGWVTSCLSLSELA